MWGGGGGIVEGRFCGRVAGAGFPVRGVRRGAGPDYDADEENIVASVDVGQPSHFDTLAGLGSPGVTASYRIYAITADGNERASNTVTITRPV